MNEDEIGRYFENKYKTQPIRDLVEDDSALGPLASLPFVVLEVVNFNCLVLR